MRRLSPLFLILLLTGCPPKAGDLGNPNTAPPAYLPAVVATLATASGLAQMAQGQAIEQGKQTECMAFGAAQVVIRVANGILADSTLMTFPATEIDLSSCKALSTTDEEGTASADETEAESAEGLSPMLVATIESLLEGTLQVLTSYGDSFRKVDCINFQRTTTGLRYIQGLATELVDEIQSPDWKVSLPAQTVDIAVCTPAAS